MPSDLLFLVYLLFFGVNILLGLLYRDKDKNIRTYGWGTSSLGLKVMILSLLSTQVGVLDIGLHAHSHQGLISLLPTFGLILMTMLLGWTVFPRLLAFRSAHTMAGIIHRIYGRWAQKICLLLATFFSLSLIIAQLTIWGEVSGLMGMSKESALLSLGVLLALYSSLGGFNVLIKMSLWHVGGFVLAGLGLLSLFLGIVGASGAPEGLLSYLLKKKDFLNFFQSKHLSHHLYGAFFWVIFPTLWISPSVVQRLLMVEKKEEMKQMALGCSWGYAISKLLRFGIVLCLASLKLKTPFSGKMSSFSYAIDHIESLGSFFLLIIVLCGIASSMHALLHGLALLWMHDYMRFFLSPSLYKKRGGIACRIWLLFFLMLSMLIALSTSLESVVWAGWGVIFFSPIVFPFCAGVMGIKGNKKVFLSSIGCFYLIFLLSIGYLGGHPDYAKTAWFHIGREVWGIALFGSICCFFLVHYLLHQGIIFGAYHPQNYTPIGIYTLSQLKPRAIPSLLAWANKQRTSPYYQPILLGLFTFVVCMLPLPCSSNHPSALWFLLGFRLLGCSIGTALFFHSLWAKEWHKYVGLFYFFVLFYIFPLKSILFLYVDPNGPAAFPYLLLSLVLLAFFVPHVLLIGMMAIAWLVGLFCIGVLGVPTLSYVWPAFSSSYYNGIHVLLLVGYFFFGYRLFHPREEKKDLD